MRTASQSTTSAIFVNADKVTVTKGSKIGNVPKCALSSVTLHVRNTASRTAIKERRKETFEVTLKCGSPLPCVGNGAAVPVEQKLSAT